MPVRTIEPSRRHSFEHHIDAANSMDTTLVSKLKGLAGQLHGQNVMPILGAGASFDCGMRLASEIGAELLAEYQADNFYHPHASGLTSDLGDVADAIFQKRDQRAVVEAVGLHDPDRWPAAADVADHFCVYRVLGRLARERMVNEAFTFNYDCGCEAALLGEGFLSSPTTMPGRQWQDHATVISDAALNDSTNPRGAFVLTKAHGCADRYRALRAGSSTSNAENSIVIRASQIRDWRGDLWARDTFRERTRRNILLLFGFAGNDPVVSNELTRVLEDVYATMNSSTSPRVIAIDPDPDTVALRGLISAGIGSGGSSVAGVTQVSTTGTTTAAVALVLLVEMLAVRLEPNLTSRDLVVPPNVDGRVAAFALAAPAMLKWSFRLRRPDPSPEYVQRINLHQAAERGYVPLSHDLATTVAALETRQSLLAALSRSIIEPARDVLASHGFIVESGIAYLPIGIGRDELLRAVRSGELEQARRVLPRPHHLDCVLVTQDDGTRCGVSIDTGKEVPVP